MHPELFSMSGNFFKAIDVPVCAPDAYPRGKLLPEELGGDVTHEDAARNTENLNAAVLPGYPVALLLVKDVTIKLKMKADATKVLQSHSERTSSSGGGFLCFSVSSTQASTADSKSVNSYAMGADFVFRIPAPQIVGVWNQIMPADRSEYLNGDDLQRILQFKEVAKLAKVVTGVQPHVEVAPSKPGR
jgi:hypothetical protein